MLMLAGLVTAGLLWRERPRRAQAVALLVIVVGLSYAWLGLGKV
ncbi:MAG: hypothetical protein WCB85_08720 [Candidatus Dormiibacterota bacterium]